ncbi:hypothetical protein [Solidesulfovibrio sp. C21]|uniref:hypothetical protein n=1 Tax=Solidesulfovibrio sp. C21 TaxID=3398613 RepID=UPI0039FD4C59
MRIIPPMDRPTLHRITKDGQKSNSTEPEDELDYSVEVSSAANVLRFFEEYFNTVGDGTVQVTDEDGYALAHIFGLCSKRLYQVLL